MHYPNKNGFQSPPLAHYRQVSLTKGCRRLYDQKQELSASDLIDLQSGNGYRGICTLRFTCQPN